ncbi:tetratricopeptide repeat-containing glycosyltransferase family protein [Telmatospirillum sp.]|uniref:tetratricopeptide repeat protein n=1 Tax=Telmatospirillum sp. TaxID=2079197 RepID=UPI00283F5D1A|nr:tetratricopeptide repeat-containing glycosyltransferase family protein [Telmatospirillum sp.]MDR3435830.1 tetratricopeptide repeat-containing glycosyltransferase family protein [Telmatospirillum sp.]
MDVDRLFAMALAKHQDGFLDEAVATYQQVLASIPDAIPAWVNLGLAWQGLGHLPQAASALCRAVVLAPESPMAVDLCNDLGNLLSAQRRFAEAETIFHRAISLGPEFAQPYNNLAAMQVDAGEPAAALAACRRALAIQPENPQAFNNLGNALMELGQTEAAVGAFMRALSLQPDFAEAATNLSGALIDQGASEAAIALCRQAIALRPEQADVYNNLGNALREAGRLAEAAKVFQRALWLAPDDAEIHYNASSVLLKRGDFAAGWREFEWRKRTERSAFRKMPLPGPEWNGQSLHGKTLLLYAEQGLGDVLQFVRYVPEIAARVGGPVVLRVFPPLRRLLTGFPGTVAVVSTDDPLPDYDCHMPLMSLPMCCGTVLETIPAAVPYLFAEPSAVQGWRDRLAAFPGRKVGLVWAGDPRPHQRGAHLMDRRRSLALAQFVDALRVPGIQWISLQKGGAGLQARMPPAGADLWDPMDEIGDFADTAALVSALDLVVTVDTSVAHLAGGLGKPFWLVSRFDGCWRWLDGCEHSPWYPTARIYHQTAWSDWRPVLRRLSLDLARWVTMTAIG